MVCLQDPMRRTSEPVGFRLSPIQPIIQINADAQDAHAQDCADHKEEFLTADKTDLQGLSAERGSIKIEEENITETLSSSSAPHKAYRAPVDGTAGIHQTSAQYAQAPAGTLSLQASLTQVTPPAVSNAAMVEQVSNVMFPPALLTPGVAALGGVSDIGGDGAAKFYAQ